MMLGGCAASSDDGSDPEANTQDVSSIPSEGMPSWIQGLQWMGWLKENYPEWYLTSNPSEVDARPWGEGYDPRTNPVFSHNTIEIVGVTPRDVLALLQAGRSDTYYQNSGPALDCDTGEAVTLSLGTKYCWTTFGSVQHMQIVELVSGDDESVIAWEGGQFGVHAYHRWIMRKTSEGTHVITEECEHGLMPSIFIYKNKMNPSLRDGHELWLHGMQAKLTGQPSELRATP
ncbi:hypothetical protein AKJ09_05945 [Labilithrix luteola]|uniref:Uncharacterized protein n=2 Tax=Labilithrix luteola TaxID=1391654 RepID=A0A0K1Q0Y3_9BACT|nr:hypothetical protein AKJ09_05945 [Labilithrix luteola]